MTEPLVFRGAPGSPYTRKMRALLRYRHVPHRFVCAGSREDAGHAEPKVHLLPTFFLKDESGAEVAVTDSSPLLRRFEREFEGRSVIPTDPAVAFLDFLLEDFGDEWLTKPMFHYRWYYDADVAKAGSVLPLWQNLGAPPEQHAQLAKYISERQVSRLWVVGSNDTTASVIEESYRRILRLLDAHLQQARFLLGERPSSSDFAWYGQLTQLVLFDPTPAAVALEESPRTYAWVEILEDLTGVEPREDDWFTREALPDTLRGILGEVGRVYAPFLLANKAALDAGSEKVECTIDGRPWTQKAFPYQGKCLVWLREQHAALGADDRAWVDSVLAGTGCESLFA